MALRIRPFRALVPHRSIHTTSFLLNENTSAASSDNARPRPTGASAKSPTDLGFGSRNVGRVRDLGKLDIPSSGRANIAQSPSQLQLQSHSGGSNARAGQPRPPRRDNRDSDYNRRSYRENRDNRSNPSPTRTDSSTPSASVPPASSIDTAQFFEHSVPDIPQRERTPGSRLLDRVSDELNDLPSSRPPPPFRNPRAQGQGPRAPGSGPRRYDGQGGQGQGGRPPFDGPRRFDGPRPPFAGARPAGAGPGSGFRGPGGPGGPRGARGPGGPGGQKKRRPQRRDDGGGRDNRTSEGKRIIEGIWGEAPPPPPPTIDRSPSALFGKRSFLIPSVTVEKRPEQASWAADLSVDQARKAAILRAAGDISTVLPSIPLPSESAHRGAAAKSSAAFAWSWALSRTANQAGDAKRQQVIQAAELVKRLTG